MVGGLGEFEPTVKFMLAPYLALLQNSFIHPTLSYLDELPRRAPQ